MGGEEIEGWTCEWEGRGERRLDKGVGGEGREKVGRGTGRGGELIQPSTNPTGI